MRAYHRRFHIAVLGSTVYCLDLRDNRELLNSGTANSVVLCVRDGSNVILCIKKASSLPWSRLEYKGAGRKGGKCPNSQYLLSKSEALPSLL